MNEDILKKAFSKVKEDMQVINDRLDRLESQLNVILTNSNQKIASNPPNSIENRQYKPQTSQIQQSSSGNEGVQSINHSTINQSINDQSSIKHEMGQYTPQISNNYKENPKTNHSLSTQSLSTQSTNIHSLNLQSLKQELESRFNALTNQEFLIFLTIYQLEEDLRRPVTYNDLSTKLSLTSGCIRGYISALIRKSLPVIKSKINNRTLTLSINPEFRDLNLKEKLTNIYYNQDPDQTKLF
jgi:hypothetical protein